MKRTNNKQINEAYQRYLFGTTNGDIYSAYQRPSVRKVHAWNSCEELCRKYEGTGLRIIGHNSMIFSAGFIGYVENEETGELEKSFVYITPSYNRYMPLEVA